MTKTTVTTPYTFDCNLCEFTSSTQEALTHHIRRDHTEAGVNKDKGQRDIVPRGPQGASLWEKLPHGEDGKIYKCLKCVCVFRNPNVILEHDRKHHSEGSDMYSLEMICQIAS